MSSGLDIALIQTRTPATARAALAHVEPLIREAASGGAKFILTPEGTNVLEQRRDQREAAITIEDEDVAVLGLRRLAVELGVWLLIGSAIEIPLLLYILHRRAKEFNENRARLRAIESTDPLTGLTVAPVLTLRLRDAMRRARRYGHRCGLVLVDLANHVDIVSREGREAGDRALVVAASRLSAVVRDVDTVCRTADARFVVLVEGPLPADELKRLAQHIVARGLERIPALPADIALRFRLVSMALPDDTATAVEDDHLIAHMGAALDRMVSDPRKVVQHLSPPAASPLPQEGSVELPAAQKWAK